MNPGIPSVIADDLQLIFTEKEGSTSRIVAFEPIFGGSINSAGKISLNRREFFIKWNDRATFPGMLDAEAKGLELLKASTDLMVPEVVRCGDSGPFQYLVLSLIKSAKRQHNYWENLAMGLARIHKNNHSLCGLEYSNYIGSLPQSNLQCSSWPAFFIHERLEKQVVLAASKGKCDSEMRALFHRLYRKLDQYLVEEKHCLVHGDLWSGNVIVDATGAPVLIDPAVYFGNREMDIAMSRLFGGFEPAFYDAYADCFPLENGFEDRINIYNLYPLLVHLNLFGGGYYQQIMHILRRFAR